ncbi:ATP-binding protein [Bradyrhizobium embrapense]
MKQPDAKQARGIPAEYRQGELPEYRGNPLIEAIPPFRTAKELMPFFGKYPHVGNADRLLPPRLRMLAVLRLNDYLEPLHDQFDLVEQIEIVILAGYVQRNPATSDYQKALINLYRKSMAGSICPIQTSGPSTAPSCSLFGISGGGKSTVVERILSFYPQAISHPKYGFTQLVWLKLDCPLDGSLKQLLRTLILRIDEILKTTYAELSTRAGVDELVGWVAKIAAQHHLGLLVIDEIQNLLQASGVGPAKMLNFFVTLANDAKIPFCVVGTSKAKAFLETLFREARRLSASAFWDRMSPGKHWDYFLRRLSKYQWTADPVDLSDPKMSKLVYFHTQGIRDLVVRLFQLCQLRAIRSGSERISARLIENVVSESFVLLRRPLDALRSGNPDEIEKYEDLLSSGLLQLRSQVVAGKGPTLEQSQRAETKRKSDRLRLLSNLLKLGIDEKEAQLAVDAVFSNVPANQVRREQIFSKIIAADLQNPGESLIEHFREAMENGADMIAAPSSGENKARRGAGR